MKKTIHRCMSHNYILLVIFLVISCDKNPKNQPNQVEVNSAIETHRVGIYQYEILKHKALVDNDREAANLLANHFRFTEPNKKLADFWLAITARNGSDDAASVFIRRGSTYSKFLEENPINTIIELEK